MPTRPLPAHPNLAQLKRQSKDLLRAHDARSEAALQRIREFHPRFHGKSDAAIAGALLKLSDAQLAIAREYGFASWPRLKAYVESDHPEDFTLPMHERINDTAFRRAVDFLDAGDVEGLRAHLRVHPGIVKARMSFEGGNYFREPTLLEFIAENPLRHGSLPRNAAEVARVVLEAGAKADRAAMNSALDLVASSAVTRKCGVQVELIDLLCDYGADPDTAVYAPFLYGEFAAVQKLVSRGAQVDLVVATGLGLIDEARSAFDAADDVQRQKALGLAAQHGRLEIARMLLDAGVNPDRYSLGHSHATPLHQAALAGHLDVVKLFVEHGARTDIPDIHWGGTALGWAEYGNQVAVAEYLRGSSPKGA